MALPKIEMPTYKVKLNSAKKELTFRPMTVKQNKILLMARESNTQRDVFVGITDVLQQCLVDPFDIGSLPMYDITWLYIKLRAASVSNKISFSINGEAGKEIPLSVNLDDVKLEAEKKRSNLIDINGKVGVRVKDVPVSVYMSDKFNTAVENEKEDDMWSMLFAGSVETIVDGEAMIDSKTLSYDELVEWFDSLPAKALTEFREFVASAPEFKHAIKYKEADDGKEQEFVLSSLNDFFLL